MPKALVNGIMLKYEIRGEGPPLVLLMGLGADGSLWEEHVRTYERYYRCILIDNRGAGGSDKPDGPYTIAKMAEDTIGLLVGIGIDSAHFSGISMGGAIAQEVALKAPGLVRSLTLICTWASCSPYSKLVFETLHDAYPRMQPSEFQRLLQLFIFSPAYHETHHNDLLQLRMNARDNSKVMPANAFVAQCRACITHDTTNRLSAITAPVLITVGSLDMLTPLSSSQSIALELKHAELAVFEGCGHAHHWEDLKAFNDQTLHFMLKQEELL